METVEVPKELWDEVTTTLEMLSLGYHHIAENMADELLPRIRQHFDGPEESE